MTEQHGSYVIEVPRRELEIGAIRQDESYRVALIGQIAGAQTGSSTGSKHGRERESAEPSAVEGDTIEMEIEDIGEQGDGLGRIGPGFIVFVSDTEVGDRVTVNLHYDGDGNWIGPVVRFSERSVFPSDADVV